VRERESALARVRAYKGEGGGGGLVSWVQGISTRGEGWGGGGRGEGAGFARGGRKGGGGGGETSQLGPWYFNSG